MIALKKKKRIKLHPVMSAASVVDMPIETDSSLAKMTIYGHRRAVIENHRGVYSYTDGGISLTGPEGMIAIHGNGLIIRALDNERMLLEGYITGISYE